MKDWSKIKKQIWTLEQLLECTELVQMSYSDINDATNPLLERAWKMLAQIQGQIKDSETSEIDDLTLIDNVEELKKQIKCLSSEDWHLEWGDEHISAIRKEIKRLKKDYPNELGCVFWTKRNVKIGIIFACVFAFVICSLFLWMVLRDQPWRIAYFADPYLSGKEVYVTHDDVVSLADKNKFSSIAKYTNGFSVRYEACLDLDKNQNVRFTLGSDDGSRLYVDNNILIDNWGPHGFLTKESELMLPKGVHKFVIEYQDVGGVADISFSSIPEDIITTKYLRALDDEGQCR